MAKLDDASWHLGSDEFPEDTPEENAATHIGMFVAWAIHNDLWGQFPGVDWSSPVVQVRNREITGRMFVLDQCDGKLLSEMLNEKGAPFAEWYYDRYLKDFQRTLAKSLGSDYFVQDTWENYERIAGVLTEQYKNPQPVTKPWWEFW
ncbi:MAG: hypothetical protein IPP59_16335 [Betaproteobacteria bacterium]|jgi:hypothetical protein|nr:hypothetical protein [Betaproteobacteria bacterium]MBK9785612.1 hypothetical protein [Candidatus Dechloromonas phosphorivorans]